MPKLMAMALYQMLPTAETAKFMTSVQLEFTANPLVHLSNQIIKIIKIHTHFNQTITTNLSL